jgi:hypothetical protein
MTHSSTPVFSAGARVRRSAGTADTTVGFRVNPQILLKAGYQGSRSYSQQGWEHAAAVQAVWAKRFW